MADGWRALTAEETVFGEPKTPLARWRRPPHRPV